MCLLRIDWGAEKLEVLMALDWLAKAVEMHPFEVVETCGAVRSSCIFLVPRGKPSSASWGVAYSNFHDISNMVWCMDGTVVRLFKNRCTRLEISYLDMILMH